MCLDLDFASDMPFHGAEYSISDDWVFFQMLAFMHAQSTYFHQGSDLFEDMEPYIKKVASQVCLMLLILCSYLVISSTILPLIIFFKGKSP